VVTESYNAKRYIEQNSL